MDTEYGFKSCPFCGGKEFKIETDTCMPDEIHMAWVACQNGECETRGPQVFWYEDMREAKDEAVIAWNKRK